ncbi:hypothetical protein Y1Q_0023666 [Alligator mississippiensis]|uniref:Uncharacterized protein n=1 Tax=Alligator mississippiensis TaxID=8496 RepID=A0A151P1U6_ALLMI|nr:hypothetical protein Y1Q_0023666 [Alligator mississippiensis]
MPALQGTQLTAARGRPWVVAGAQPLAAWDPSLRRSEMDTHPKMSGEHARTARESRMDTHTTCTQNPGVQDEHSRTWVSEMDRRTYTHACLQNRWTIHVREKI